MSPVLWTIAVWLSVTLTLHGFLSHKRGQEVDNTPPALWPRLEIDDCCKYGRTERGKRCLNAHPGADAILPNTHKSPEHPRDSGCREGAHFKCILDTACLSGLHCYCFTFRSLNKIASLPLQVWAETDPPVSLSSNELLREPGNSKFA